MSPLAIAGGAGALLAVAGYLGLTTSLFTLCAFVASQLSSLCDGSAPRKGCLRLWVLGTCGVALADDMQVVLKSLLLARIFLATAAGAIPIELQETPETLPIIEVRLTPPANPLPEVGAEIQALEKARDALEQEQTAKLEAAYNAALEGARSEISALMHDSWPCCAAMMQGVAPSLFAWFGSPPTSARMHDSRPSCAAMKHGVVPLLFA